MSPRRLLLLFFLPCFSFSFRCPPRCQCYKDDDPRSKDMHLICKWDKLNTTNLESLDRKDLVRTLTIRCPHLTKHTEQTPPPGLFRGLWKLDRLEVDRCQLIRLPNQLFLGLHQLYSLVLRNAQLTELPRDIFSHLPNLMTLDLSGNRLRIEPHSLTSLRSLIHLDLSNNSIGFLANTMVSLTKLRVLTLDHNLLTNVDFRRLPEELTDLSLRHNEITTVHYVPNSARSLRRLDLAGNKLDFLASFGSVNVIPPGLHSLDLSLNRISHLQEGALRPLSQLALLNLRNNSLTEVSENTFSGSRSPLRVMLAGNPFDCTCSLRWLFHPSSSEPKSQVAVVDLPNLRCRHVTRRDRFLTLRHADSTNQLMCKYSTTCPPKCDCCHEGPACPCLEVCPQGCVCHESSTPRTNRTVHNSVRCDSLRLDALGNLPQTLTDLALNDVDWKKWPPESLLKLSSLTSLSISRSRLSNEEAEWFSQLTNLTELDLSSNRISHLSQRPPHLRRLILSNNPLADLPSHSLLSGLVSVSFAGNDTEFTCDCDAPTALQKWLGDSANRARLEDIEEVECELKGAGRVPLLAVLAVNDSLCDLMTTEPPISTQDLAQGDEIFGTEYIPTFGSNEEIEFVTTTRRTTTTERSSTSTPSSTWRTSTTKWQSTTRHKHKYAREIPESNQFLDALIILLVVSIVVLLVAISATFYYRVQQMKDDSAGDDAREPL